MHRDRVQAGATVIILLGLLLFCLFSFRTTSDITRFLQVEAGDESLKLAQAMADSALSRTMILALRAKDAGKAAAAARRLAAELEGHPEVEWIRTTAFTEAADQDRIRELYFPRRLRFLSDDPDLLSRESLTDEEIRRAAADLKRALQGPTGPLVARLGGSDPFQGFSRTLQRLSDLREPKIRILEGQFVARDAPAGIIFLSTRASPFDTRRVAPFLDFITAAFDEINKAEGGALSLERSGLAFFAAASEASIRRDVARISFVSTAVGIGLFLLMFRSPAYILLFLVTIGGGLICGLAACLAVFGEIHGVTMVFGATLIGVCIDYPIHLFNHYLLRSEEEDAGGTLARIWPGIRLGALTTIGGIAGMAWTTFPGLRESAVFATAGILGALACTRFLLPVLMPQARRPTAFLKWAAAGIGALWLRLAQRRTAVIVVLSGAIMLIVTGLPRLRWAEDLASLNTIDRTVQEEDQRVRGLVSSMDSGRFIVVSGRGWEETLRRNDAVAARLQAARRDGVIGSYRTLHGAIWSRQLQDRNVARVRATRDLEGRLVAAFSEEGFRPGSFRPFFEHLKEADQGALTMEQLADSPLRDAVRGFVVKLDPESGERTILTQLQGISDPERLRTYLASLDGVVYFDQGSELRRLYRSLQDRTFQAMGIGTAIVFALLFVQYRSLLLSFAALLPAVAAAAGALAAVSIMGMPSNVLNLIGSLLILGIGVDYGIFLIEGKDSLEHMSGTLLSIVLASSTTVLSFGLLGLSSNPGLQGIGITAGLGSVLSLVIGGAVILLLPGRRPV